MIRLLRGAKVAWNTGAWRQSPDRLYKLLRHRREFSRVSKALFYHRFATALFVAVELGVFEALLESPQSSGELAERCKAHPEAIRTLLRILESQDWVSRRGEEVALTEFARDFFEAELGEARTFALYRREPKNKLWMSLVGEAATQSRFPRSAMRWKARSRDSGPVARPHCRTGEGGGWYPRRCGPRSPRLR